MISIIDTDVPLTAARLDQLWNSGVRSIGRYLNRRNPKEAKVIQPAEAKLFAARGMRLFLIYEFDGRPSGSLVGAADGTYVFDVVAALGCPSDGSQFIAYTVDYDALESAMPGIRAAFASFAKAVAPKIGTWAYASGAVNGELYAAKLITGRWLTCSDGFRGTKEALAAGAYEMRQALPDEIAGLDTDPDSCHVATFVPGFIPFAPAPAVPALVAAAPASEGLLARFEDYWKGKAS